MESSESQPDISIWEGILRAIDSALDRLHFVAVAIRKASAKKIEYNLAIVLTDQDIVFRRDVAALVRLRFPAARRSICQQIGDSIAARRRMLFQKHIHAKKLTIRRVVTGGPPSKQRHSSEPDFKPVGSTPAKDRIARNLSVPATGATKASRPDPQAPALKHLHHPKRPALTTVVSEISTSQQDSFEYPPPPKANDGDTRVQCPYCLMPLDHRELERKGYEYWTHHVDEDIKPYACLFPECSEALVVFTRRHEWKSHMESVHSKDWPRKVHTIIWYCDIDHNPPEQFETEILWRDHMQNLDSHAKRKLTQPTKAQLDALSPRKQQVALRDRFVCPLCEQIPERIRSIVEKGLGNPQEGDHYLIDHVANHIKSISLLAVPSLGDSPAPLGTEGDSIVMKDSFRRLLHDNSIPQPPSGIELLDGLSLPSAGWSTTARENNALLLLPDTDTVWDEDFPNYAHPEHPPDMLADSWVQALEIWKVESDPLTQESTESDPVLSHLKQAKMATEVSEEVTDITVLENSDIDSRDQLGRTVLCRAVERKLETAVRVLLDRGANTEVADRDGRTPLLRAAASGYEGIIKLLLDKGARIEAADQQFGMTSLSWAAMNGHEAVVLMLLDNGADIESADNSHRTPLSWAASRGHEAIVQLFLERGANIEASDHKYGRTPLSWAAARGHDAIVRLLLIIGANPEATDREHNRTPLSWAAASGYDATVKALLTAGANIEVADQYYGQTPLAFAAENGHEAVVELLLQAGANVHAVDKKGQTALSWADENNHKSVVQILQSYVSPYRKDTTTP